MIRKQYLLLVPLVLIFTMGAYFVFPIPRNLESFFSLSELEAVTLINTVHKAPTVTIDSDQDIKGLFGDMGSYEFKRKFLVLMPIGSEFALNFEHSNGHKTKMIFITREIVKINNQFYKVDSGFTDRLITRLVSKEFAGEADLVYARDITKIINEVSNQYGESKLVLSIKDTISEKDFRPMYLITLKGSFAKGNLKATKLSFSMLADGSSIWSILGTDDKNQVVWEEHKFSSRLLGV